MGHYGYKSVKTDLRQSQTVAISWKMCIVPIFLFQYFILYKK
jgi:hypothetical protein